MVNLYPQLSDEEHRARALLLDAKYMEAINAYAILSSVPGLYDYFDADTMEQLSIEEIAIRINNTSKPFYDGTRSLVG